MEESDHELHTTQLIPSTELTAISERKLKANRENALKSTGPKTARGKAYSRRNALKHGLFVNRLTDFEALSENPHEYDALLKGLLDHYQPLGRAEEIAVERVAVCCWRLKRAWRYENAMNLDAAREVLRSEVHEQGEYCQKLDQEEAATIKELQIAKEEIDKTGQVSDELKQRIFAMQPGFEAMWARFDEQAQHWVKQPNVWKRFRRLKPEGRSLVLRMYTVEEAISFFEHIGQRRYLNVMETAIGRHAIPTPDVVDTILRYEAAAERSLDRALARLERLQRRRLGERIPPPLNLCLTH